MRIHGSGLRQRRRDFSYTHLSETFKRSASSVSVKICDGSTGAGLCTATGTHVSCLAKRSEEKGQSLQRLRAVDTPLAVDCGSCVIPFPGRIPTLRWRTIRLEPGLT